MKATLISTMKNEGPFILEWIAYHKVIGFDQIVIGSNDCADGSDVLLDALAAEGIIVHRRNVVSELQDPQHTFLTKIYEQNVVRQSEWLMVLDADEFLSISPRYGSLSHLLSSFEFPDAIPVLWKNFGDAGVQYWNGGLIVEQFNKCELEIRSWNRYHKTIFHNNGVFSALSAHYPLFSSVDAASKAVVRNTAGERYDNRVLEHAFPRLHAVQDLEAMWTWENACVCHFPYKTRDLFLMKRYRGDNVPGIAEKKYSDGSSYEFLRNCNEVVDDSLKRFVPDIEVEIGKMRSNRKIRESEVDMLLEFSNLREKVIRLYSAK